MLSSFSRCNCKNASVIHMFTMTRYEHYNQGQQKAGSASKENWNVGACLSNHRTVTWAMTQASNGFIWTDKIKIKVGFPKMVYCLANLLAMTGHCILQSLSVVGEPGDQRLTQAMFDGQRWKKANEGMAKCLVNLAPPWYYILSYFHWFCRLLSLLTHLCVGSMTFSILPLFIKSQETNQPLIKGDVQLLQVPFGWKRHSGGLHIKVCNLLANQRFEHLAKVVIPVGNLAVAQPPTQSACFRSSRTIRSPAKTYSMPGKNCRKIQGSNPLKASLGCSTTNPRISCLWSLKSEKRPQPPQQSSL